MKVNFVATFLNWWDWERFNAKDWTREPPVRDDTVINAVLALGDLAEPLGFDGIWAADHYATPYTMTPNPLQLLAYFAGRTERVDVGTCVIVLPWWHPLRVAHQIAFLDILLKGRKMMLGLGRGVSRQEFEPAQVPREETRQRFKESLDILKLALSQERFSYEGKIYQIPETSIRPMASNDDILDHLYGAANTPDSMDIMARSGLKQMFVGSKPVDATTADVLRYNTLRREVGLGPSQPIQLTFAYCAARKDQAAEGYEYFARYQDEAAYHYGLRDPENFRGVAGYENYAAVADRDPTIWAKNTLTGTPDQIIERVMQIQRATSCDQFSVVFHFGGMPFEEARRSMRLFAQEVLPVVQKMASPLHADMAPALEIAATS
jgi:alkanesulfonate monooxygenase SsuD/methylene tetrahydromethanopterin reductase-like flavin-dependent oxidoreductase (luciferase family)